MLLKLLLFFTLAPLVHACGGGVPPKCVLNGREICGDDFYYVCAHHEAMREDLSVLNAKLDYLLVLHGVNLTNVSIPSFLPISAATLTVPSAVSVIIGLFCSLSIL